MSNERVYKIGHSDTAFLKCVQGNNKFCAKICQNLKDPLPSLVIPNLNYFILDSCISTLWPPLPLEGKFTKNY